ncbi:hypothetical protein SAMN05216391_10950 [Lachnospiraceae bacterium KHCPX20]|nr:hypothetical protein SAMN05216391_10950 [Lachnospiraceae bacterium KHCPX20]
MTNSNFIETFTEGLKAKLAARGVNAEFTTRRVEKLNDSYDAITVTPVGSAIGVNISVDQALDVYNNGASISSVAERFADAIEKALAEKPQVDLEALSDYEQLKSKLFVEVVSAEKNAELLKSAPHDEIEDMAIVYRILVDHADSGNSTILITNQMMEQYGISKEQLRADALENAPKIRPVEVKGMSEVMRELAPGMVPEVAPEDEQMFVASVPDKIHGAGIMAYPGFFESSAEKLGGDFFILPSSIHEVLLVPDDGRKTAEDLLSMVKEVNATQVKPEDLLTDSVYHYGSAGFKRVA